MSISQNPTDSKSKASSIVSAATDSRARAAVARSNEQMNSSHLNALNASKTRAELVKSSTAAAMSPPPKIQVPDGKSSKWVVDTKELKKLKQEYQMASTNLDRANANIAEAQAAIAASNKTAKVEESKATSLDDQKNTLEQKPHNNPAAIKTEPANNLKQKGTKV